MEGISDIKISGFDELRPPMVRKEPYINLYFKLSHKAPKKWCNDFNDLVAKGKYPVKIEPGEGLFIETWVRQSGEIEHALHDLKKAVGNCSQNYISRIAAETRSEIGASANVSKEQMLLNQIIEGLKFEN